MAVSLLSLADPLWSKNSGIGMIRESCWHQTAKHNITNRNQSQIKHLLHQYASSLAPAIVAAHLFLALYDNVNLFELNENRCSSRADT